MRNNLRKLACVAVSLLVLIGSTVYAMPQPQREIYQKMDFIYEVLSNETVAIHFYTGEDDIVKVPANIDGLPVRRIESHAFYGTQVKDVIISEGITTLCDEAFYNCALETLQLPSTLKEVGTGVFRYCENLKEAQIAQGASLGKYMFYGCASLANVALPSGTQVVEEGMFAYCTSLKTIKLPQKLQKICDYAFYGSGLTAFEVPTSLNSIGTKTFAQCTELASITAKSEEVVLVCVEQDAFEGCPTQFPEKWKDNGTVPDEPAAQPSSGYMGSDPTEPPSDLTPDATFPQPPIDEPTINPPTVAPQGTDPVEPSTTAPIQSDEPCTVIPTESATSDVVTNDEFLPDDDFVTDDGFYIGSTEGFFDFENENSLSAKDAVLNNKKELLELAWNVRNRGDVNLDNRVNIRDATAVQKYVANLLKPTDKFEYKNADVNTDGKVNVKDATAIQKSIAGMESI